MLLGLREQKRGLYMHVYLHACLYVCGLCDTVCMCEYIMWKHFIHYIVVSAHLRKYDQGASEIAH